MRSGLMKLSAIVFSILCIAASAEVGISPNHQALVADLKDYHQDIGAFESLAARALREGIPDSVITLRRYFCYLQHGEIAPLRVLIPQLEKAKDDILSQQFEPMTAAQFEKTLEVGRKLIEASQKNPSGTVDLVAASHRFAQAVVHMKDLRRIDAAIDMYSLENNQPNGAPVPVEAWKRYMPKNQRLWRTGADCLGNAYGPQVVGQRPKVARAAYERIAGSVPKDYFKPFEVADK
jgi:hypothetical protein